MKSVLKVFLAVLLTLGTTAVFKDLSGISSVAAKPLVKEPNAPWIKSTTDSACLPPLIVIDGASFVEATLLRLPSSFPPRNSLQSQAVSLQKFDSLPVARSAPIQSTI